MCLSPDEMTTKELIDLEKYYREIGWTYQADQIKELIGQREADGTTDIVPETTPRHLNSTVN